MKCHLCNSEAIAIFNIEKGCIVSKEIIQPLCEHHFLKITTLGKIELIEDLTLNKEFTNKYLMDK